MNMCNLQTPRSCEDCYGVVESVVAKSIISVRRVGDEPLQSDVRHELVRDSMTLLDHDFPLSAVNLTDELTCAQRKLRAEKIANGRVTAFCGSVAGAPVLEVIPGIVIRQESLAQAS